MNFLLPLVLNVTVAVVGSGVNDAPADSSNAPQIKDSTSVPHDIHSDVTLLNIYDVDKRRMSKFSKYA